ncbi:hypothetical protein [Terrisporobacter glycolicus]|uniref:Lipoprotein n=1 Tax=Terrisporobacter glycolicus ATCC 14880 = DSM 1288 TaxID=1121315 RepID=A0ABZ2EXE2_9FIRM|nr:hypothetical protein [Terrisporobacter glycolicus]
MKKLLAILSAFIICLSMVACSSSDEPKSQDNAFIKDIKKSFEARSNYLDDVESGKITSSENEYLKDAVKKEKGIIEKYNDAKFDSPELAKLSKDYITALNTQEESLKYYSSDYTKFDKLWTEGYNQRSTILTTLIDKFGLVISDDAIEELKTNAQVVKEKNDTKEKIDKMLKNIKFKKVKDEYGWKDYEAVVENTTGVDLEYFYLDVKLIDSDDVIIESIPSTVDGTWANGKKVKLTFSTDKKFKKLEWTADYSIKE